MADPNYRRALGLIDLIGNPLKRDSAVKQLAGMADIPSEAIPVLAATLRDTTCTAKTHRLSIEALERIGPAAVAALIDVFLNDDRATCDAAVDALGRIGPRAIPALMQAIRDAVLKDDSMTCELAIDALGEIGSPAVPALTEALGFEGGYTSRRVLRSLEYIGPAAVPALVAVLGDTDNETRRDAIEALRRMGPPGKAAAALAAPSKDHPR